MGEKKSIIEEALLDITNIQNALNANTKEILRSVAIKEIDSVVKESLSNEGFEEEDITTSDEPMGDEPVSNVDSTEITDGGMDTTGLGAEELPDETGMDDFGSSEELDMTSASDDDVIAIYKKLSGDDEIQIVGDEIHLSVSEPGDYVIKTPTTATETGDNVEDEVDYEIEMSDDEDGGQPSDLTPVDDSEGQETSDSEESSEEEEETSDSEESSEEEEETSEEPIEEKISIGTGMSVGTHRNPNTGGSIGAPENPKAITETDKTKENVSKIKQKYNMLLAEANKLKAENEEFKKALKEFRKKLVETVVFNSNLTYVTKLFTEHTTTKAEKQNIIKRFDEQVSDLKESKKLYKTIVNELETRKPISETIENKIIKEATTSSSKKLNESTAFVDPSTKRILDLINRVEKK